MESDWTKALSDDIPVYWMLNLSPGFAVLLVFHSLAALKGGMDFKSSLSHAWVSAQSAECTSIGALVL